eukprot:Nk52_evm15s304 gene=Nk52_evmTU15s304
MFQSFDDASKDHNTIDDFLEEYFIKCEVESKWGKYLNGTEQQKGLESLCEATLISSDDGVSSFSAKGEDELIFPPSDKESPGSLLFSQAPQKTARGSLSPLLSKNESMLEILGHKIDPCLDSQAHEPLSSSNADQECEEAFINVHTPSRNTEIVSNSDDDNDWYESPIAKKTCNRKLQKAYSSYCSPTPMPTPTLSPIPVLAQEKRLPRGNTKVDSNVEKPHTNSTQTQLYPFAEKKDKIPSLVNNNGGVLREDFQIHYPKGSSEKKKRQIDGFFVKELPRILKKRNSQMEFSTAEICSQNDIKALKSATCSQQEKIRIKNKVTSKDARLKRKRYLETLEITVQSLFEELLELRRKQRKSSTANSE